MNLKNLTHPAMLIAMATSTSALYVGRATAQPVNYCYLGERVAGVEIISSWGAPCITSKTWGWRHYRQHGKSRAFVWVSEGCRGEFEYTSLPPLVPGYRYSQPESTPPTQKIRCESY